MSPQLARYPCRALTCIMEEGRERKKRTEARRRKGGGKRKREEEGKRAGRGREEPRKERYWNCKFIGRGRKPIIIML